MIPNPLRDPRDRRLPRVPEPCALVVFGITGDLARKKLLPAVYDLANRGLLPTNFALLGFARRDWGDSEFAELVARVGPAARPHPVAGGGLGAAGRRHHVRARAPSTTTTPSTSWPRPSASWRAPTASAATRPSTCPSRRRCSRPCSSRCSAPGMAESTPDRWRRVVVEKPFGEDLPSSRELNALVDSVFSADDVFRIDHYLGKETVQNLLALRFANTLFEPIWNGHHVDSVQITMAEDVGIGGRAAFYEKTGAARDVLQNHLLQLLALTAMEEPVEFSAEEIRTEKLKVLRAISLPEDMETFAVRGQYEQGWLAGQRVQGYRQEDGVDPKSTTETFAAVRLGVETRRWAGRAVLPAHRQAAPPPGHRDRAGVQARPAPALRRDRHRGARQQPARRPGAARRGRDPQVRVEGAGQRDGGPGRVDGLPLRRAVHRVAAPRPTSGCCSTCCSATPRCSRATPRSRPPGR